METSSARIRHLSADSYRDKGLSLFENCSSDPLVELLMGAKARSGIAECLIHNEGI